MGDEKLGEGMDSDLGGLRHSGEMLDWGQLDGQVAIRDGRHSGGSFRTQMYHNAGPQTKIGLRSCVYLDPCILCIGCVIHTHTRRQCRLLLAVQGLLLMCGFRSWWQV